DPLGVAVVEDDPGEVAGGERYRVIGHEVEVPGGDQLLKQLPGGFADIVRVLAAGRPGKVPVEQAPVLQVPGRVLGQRRHLDGHAAQARLLRAVGLRVLQNGPQVVITGDDVIAVVGVGLEYRAGRARVREDLPEP